MNHIHQISLKLQLGIDPAIDVKPESLRELWEQRCQAQLWQRVRASRQARQTGQITARSSTG